MNKKNKNLIARQMIQFIVLACLMTSCATIPRDQSFVNKESADVATALGLTSAEFLLVTEESMDYSHRVRVTYYLTQQSVEDMEVILKSKSFSGGNRTTGYESVIEPLTQYGNNKLKMVVVNPAISNEILLGNNWIKTRGTNNADWTSVTAFLTKGFPNLYEYDGKPITGTLVRILVTYR